MMKKKSSDLDFPRSPEGDLDCLNEDDSNKKGNSVNSKFIHLYKDTKIPMNQQERREKMLSEVKARRTQAVDEKRKLTDLFDDEFEEEMECESKDFKKRRSRFKLYYNRLMLSEWFKDIPKDLEQNWIMKLCPVGSRNLVVATYNKTIAYNRVGKEQCTFKSLLPGGGIISKNNDTFTVLDCIYNYHEECFYVLDVLAWNSLSVKKCNTDFRFFWLKSKLEENPELQERSSVNEHPFVYVDSFPAELPLMEEIFSKPYLEENSAELDGILFYHREMFYINGITPLVGWLKPYMLPEMLNIPVHESYMQKKPKHYTTLFDYLQRIEEKYKKPHNRREISEQGEEMDVHEVQNDG